MALKVLCDKNPIGVAFPECYVKVFDAYYNSLTKSVKATISFYPNEDARKNDLNNKLFKADKELEAVKAAHVATDWSKKTHEEFLASEEAIEDKRKALDSVTGTSPFYSTTVEFDGYDEQTEPIVKFIYKKLSKLNFVGNIGPQDIQCDFTKAVSV